MVVACATNNTAKHKSSNDLTFTTHVFLPSSRLFPWKRLSLSQGMDLLFLGSMQPCYAGKVCFRWMISDETLFISLPPRQACLQSMAKTWTPGERDISALHRDFQGRRIFAPPRLWHWDLSLDVFGLVLSSLLGEMMRLKAFLHCYCSGKGTLKLGAVNKYFHCTFGEHGKQGANSRSQQALLKDLPK